MNARNDVKRPYDLSLDARPLLAEARLRFAAWIDVRVARWLARCVASIEAAQGVFENDPAGERGTT